MNLIIAVDRPVLDGDTGAGAALLQEPPGGGVGGAAVGIGGGADMVVVREDDAQLLAAGEMAVGRERRLEDSRHAETVRN